MPRLLRDHSRAGFSRLNLHFGKRRERARAPPHAQPLTQRRKQAASRVLVTFSRQFWLVSISARPEKQNATRPASSENCRCSRLEVFYLIFGIGVCSRRKQTIEKTENTKKRAAAIILVCDMQKRI